MEATGGPPPDKGLGSGLEAALLDSRTRWRELVALSADLAFETDVWGRFVFVWPDHPLGWPAGTLLGQPAELLLAEADGASGFNPFRPSGPVRRRRAWLKRPDGSGVCLVFAAAPLTDAEGHITGSRGVGEETTGQDGHDTAMVAALRRGELLDHILWRMRQEVMAPKMMEAALSCLSTAVGAEGAAVLDIVGGANRPCVLYQTGGALPEVLHTALSLLEGDNPAPLVTMAPDGRKVLVCPGQTRFAERTGLALWRVAGGRDWDNEERMLASSTTGLIRTILDHDRRAFLEELSRRLDRLDRENLPGTLMFVDIDHFKQLNDRLGHETGDIALGLTATLLRDTVRPADLVARLGGDEFAMWLDAADDLTAAERAEHLRVAGPRALALLGEQSGVQLTFSIGIATRWPARGEDIETVMHRADQAMYQVKRNGRGHWRVAHPEDS